MSALFRRGPPWRPRLGAVFPHPRWFRGDHVPGLVAGSYVRTFIAMSDGTWWSETENEDIGDAQPPNEDQSIPTFHQSRRSPRLPLRTQKIHILGLQTPGKFLAFALAGAAKGPEVVLLTPRRKLLEIWKQEGESITLTRHGRSETRHGLALEVVLPVDHASLTEDPSRLSEEEPISQLIVNTTSGGTVPMLQSVRHRLDRQSTILFMQNSMGLMEEVSQAVFPDIDTRPNYMLGQSSRTVIPSSTGFSIGLDGLGSMQVSLVPRYFEKMRHRRFFRDPSNATIKPVEPSASSQYLLRCLSRAPEITAVGLPYLDLLSLKLQKLAVRAIIDPLTTTFDCRNGDLLNVSSAGDLINRLAAELSTILLAMPELRNLPSTHRRMNRVHLSKQTFNILDRSAHETSSMLRDVRAGRSPDVKYVNGYFQRRAKQLGIVTEGGHAGGLNRTMMSLVWTAHALKKKQEGQFVPFDSKLASATKQGSLPSQMWQI